MATVQFNIDDSQVELLNKLINEIGRGDADRFMRETIRILAAKQRQDRLELLQHKIAESLDGRTFTTEEVVEMCNDVYTNRSPSRRAPRPEGQ